MEMCYEYSIKWRYEFNRINSGVVTFGECKLAHYENYPGSEVPELKKQSAGRASEAKLFRSLVSLGPLIQGI